MFELLIDHAPALLANQLQALEQSHRVVNGATGLGLQVGMLEVFVQGRVVQRRQ
ncbi:hypothetical protein D3C85_1582920 [compost metagenome]